MKNIEIFQLFDGQLLTELLKAIHKSLSPNISFKIRMKAIFADKYAFIFWFDKRDVVYELFEKSEFNDLKYIIDYLQRTDVPFSEIKDRFIINFDNLNYICNNLDRNFLLDLSDFSPFPLKY